MATILKRGTISYNSERHFRKAKRLIGDHRQLFSPVNFELHVCLMANKKYWSIYDVQNLV